MTVGGHRHFGAVAGPSLLAIGVSPQGNGTSQMLQEGDNPGAFSGLAMAGSAVSTAALLSREPVLNTGI
ncbi:LrgB family protein [Streptomyces iakyrus]|uniref:LrgB family protein n=1 Tax=Streptomyces iakyrus TaxID=68219 RepID=UPI0034E0DA6B